MSTFITFTFVVRVDKDSNYFDDRIDVADVDDPRGLLTDDEVMFWGSEAGVSEHAIELGADPDMWADD